MQSNRYKIASSSVEENRFVLTNPENNKNIDVSLLRINSTEGVLLFVTLEPRGDKRVLDFQIVMNRKPEKDLNWAIAKIYIPQSGIISEKDERKESLIRYYWNKQIATQSKIQKIAEDYIITPITDMKNGMDIWNIFLRDGCTLSLALEQLNGESDKFLKVTSRPHRKYSKTGGHSDGNLGR